MIAALALAAAVARCPVERATYVLRGTPTTTAHFEQTPRDDEWGRGLVLAIHGGRSGRTWYALPWPGGTDGQEHIRFTYLYVAGKDRATQRRALRTGDLDFFSLDRQYTFDQDVPRYGQAAPAHLLIPDLDLWHDPGGLMGLRDASPRAFFDRTDCHRSTANDRGMDVILPPDS